MYFDEITFQKAIEPHIRNCRDGDWNHAKRVVSWIKKLGNNHKNLNLLITAAYIHDIGWKDVLPSQKLSLEKLCQYEERANENSELFITKLLQQMSYPEKEINKVITLVKAADLHKSANDFEAIIVDADNLSKLDINHLKEKFKKEEWLKMYTMWKEKFPMRIQTKKGKEAYPELLNKLRDNISDLT